MDRNTFKAIIIIIVGIMFFSSDLYMNKIAPALFGTEPVKRNTNDEVLDRNNNEAVETINEKQESDYDSTGKEESNSLSLSGETEETVEERLITVITDKYYAQFSSKNGLLKKFVFSEYAGRDSDYVSIIPRDEGVLGVFLNNDKKKIYDFSFSGPGIDSSASEVVVDKSSVLVMRAETEFGLLEKRFTFYEGSYDFDLEIISDKNIDISYDLEWNAGIVESEENLQKGQDELEAYINYGDDVEKVSIDKDERVEKLSGYTRWIALKSKYFLASIQNPEEKDIESVFRYIKLDDENKQMEKFRNRVNTGMKFSNVRSDGYEKYRIVVSPAKHSLLSSYGNDLEKTVFSGYGWFFRADIWFPKLCALVLWLLNAFYKLIPNYGVSIIFLTIISRVVTLPMTLKSAKSMAGMKEIQPKIQELREKYSNDPVKLNKATMELYKRSGINPVSGCLPMFLQMPVFISLFVTLRKSIELRGADFVFWIKDLSQPDVLFKLPFELPFIGTEIHFLVFLMSISMFFQSKMTMQDPKQKMMVYFMPVMLFFLLYNFPSGLLVYWTLSNIIGVIQQYVTNKKKAASS